MKHLDLFSGIGGFAYAAEQVWDEDYECVGFCEIDKFCQQVLKKHWPEVKIYGDIRELGLNPNSDCIGQSGEQEVNADNKREQTQYDIKKCDLITGGFPCQPFSQAGKRKGRDDNRHLWPEMLRVIRHFQPSWVIAENVRGLLTIEGGLAFEQVCLDLEASGYEVQPFIIPAVAVNAPHRRDRVWFVANARSDRRRNSQTVEIKKGLQQEPRTDRKLERGFEGSHCPDTDLPGKGFQGHLPEQGKSGCSIRTPSKSRDRFSDWERSWHEVAITTCNVLLDDGLPVELGEFKLSKSRHRVEQLKAYGNAIVPQVAMGIMFAIKQSIGFVPREVKNG